MANWEELSRELQAWEKAGLTATFWWRDDDAVTQTGPLLRMLDLHRAIGSPLNLAVIPASADQSLVSLLADAATVDVLQHGWSHTNHAPENEKKAELGDHRPLLEILDELLRGKTHLGTLFGKQFWPVLVPPWNRIGPGCADAVAKAGYLGLSTFKARNDAVPARGLIRCNTHVDIIDWHGTRGFRGTQQVLDQAIAHLKARRGGKSDLDEATGLITHHLVHDAECWAFIEAFATFTGAHPNTRWLRARQIFSLDTRTP